MEKDLECDAVRSVEKKTGERQRRGQTESSWTGETVLELSIRRGDEGILTGAIPSNEERTRIRRKETWTDLRPRNAANKESTPLKSERVTASQDGLSANCSRFLKNGREAGETTDCMAYSGNEVH